MIRKVAGLLLAALAATSARASEGIAYVIPVVTAQVNGRVYTTTFAARNRGTQDATCEAIYAVPNDPKGGTLRAMYTVPAGGTPVVEEDLLMAAGAVGTMRIACSAPVVVAARVQVSTDGGRIFDEGRTYPGLDEAGAFRDAHTVRATSDLFVAEVAGNAVAFEAIATNENGEVLGRKTYELPAFAQQIVNLSVVRKSTKTPKVEIRVVHGDGAVVVGEETRDPEFLRMAVRRGAPSGASADAMPAVQAAPAGVRAIRELGVSPFQAAPFRDPVTGLDFFRNRWYDPRTGTFMTPDPMGYGDSPNLYAFAGGDPVNRRDPTGLYQEDVHYYATYYLARVAGFASQEAAQIAYAAQYVDDDSYTDPIKNAAPLPESNKARGEGMHFAHSPQSFVVDENNTVARNAVAEAARSRDLTRLGVSLHTLEDSFSHAGFNYEHGSHNRRTGSARPNLAMGMLPMVATVLIFRVAIRPRHIA